jgi:hypothetical protein
VHVLVLLMLFLALLAETVRFSDTVLGPMPEAVFLRDRVSVAAKHIAVLDPVMSLHSA